MNRMILGGPVWEFVLAMTMLAAGAAMVVCGVNVCWSREARQAGGSRR